MLKTYKQNKNNIIGKKKDIKSLETKEHARVLVVSDIHGDFNTLQKIVLTYGKECDALACCGDGVRDIVQMLEFSKNDKELQNAIPPVVVIVQGNCDPYSYSIFNKPIKIPLTQVLTVNEQNMMFTHGHTQGVDYGLQNYGFEMQSQNCKTGFYGHTHVAGEEICENIKFVNPGSISRPRGGQQAGFAIATVEKTFVDIAFITLS